MNNKGTKFLKIKIWGRGGPINSPSLVELETLQIQKKCSESKKGKRNEVCLLQQVSYLFFCLIDSEVKYYGHVSSYHKWGPHPERITCKSMLSFAFFFVHYGMDSSNGLCCFGYHHLLPWFLHFRLGIYRSSGQSSPFRHRFCRKSGHRNTCSHCVEKPINHCLPMNGLCKIGPSHVGLPCFFYFDTVWCSNNHLKDLWKWLQWVLLLVTELKQKLVGFSVIIIKKQIVKLVF